MPVNLVNKRSDPFCLQQLFTVSLRKRGNCSSPHSKRPLQGKLNQPEDTIYPKTTTKSYSTGVDLYFWRCDWDLLLEQTVRKVICPVGGSEIIAYRTTSPFQITVLPCSLRPFPKKIRNAQLNKKAKWFSGHLLVSYSRKNSIIKSQRWCIFCRRRSRKNKTRTPLPTVIWTKTSRYKPQIIQSTIH